MTETTGAHVTDPVPLSRELVLRTALEIIDQDGVEGLSMRRLGRDPMALYRYAASKPALLDGVAELILDELTVDTQDDDWAATLRTVARDFRRLALTHPKVVPLLVTRPLSTPLALRPPGTLRPLEATLALLTRAGFSTVDALHIYRSFFGLCTATSSMNCKKCSTTTKRPTTCCAWVVSIQGWV